VAEASEVLARHGPEAILYAGGTEILLVLKTGLLRAEHVVDVKRIAGLADLRDEAGQLVIGATATHRSVERSDVVRGRCPLVAGVARHVANVRVRTVGTVGGNLAFADPHSDLATLFLAFDAVVELSSGQASRVLALDDFLVGAYETARGDHEVLTSVTLTPWPAGTAGAYVKFGVYERPTLGVAAALLREDGGAVTAARLAVGCVSPRPCRLRAAEERMGGFTPAEVTRHAGEIAALAAAGVEPVDDLHGSAEYKREMVRVFVQRALRIAAARADGRENDERHPHTIVV
jgi:carbon-monoxide dehydrogenase medium subunit